MTAPARCLYCRKPWTPSHKDARFCSRTCTIHARTGWRRLLLHRDGHRCQVCSVLQDVAKPPALPAHLLAIARLDPGGPGTAENLVATCRGCWRRMQGAGLPSGTIPRLVEDTRARDAAGGIPDGLELYEMPWTRILGHVRSGV